MSNTTNPLGPNDPYGVDLDFLAFDEELNAATTAPCVGSGSTTPETAAVEAVAEDQATLDLLSKLEGVAGDDDMSVDFSQIMEALENEEQRRLSLNKIAALFPAEDVPDIDPETGEQRMSEGGYPMFLAHSRDKYPKQMEFFRAGNEHRERAFMAANRVGKTLAGCFEVVMHATGLYHTPEYDWWPGKRLMPRKSANGTPIPINILIAGVSSTDTRDILQNELFGPPADPGAWGTGLIPGKAIQKITRAHGIPNGIDMAMVRHVSGTPSIIQLRSFEQGREKFQGTSRDLILLDEECPEDVYDECLIRTTTTGGMVALTFTPLSGLTAVPLRFLPHLAPQVEDEVGWEDD